MKITLLTFLLSFVFVLKSPAFTSVPTTATVLVKETVVEPVVKKENRTSFKSIRKSAEKKLGRKLKLTERLGLWYYTHMPQYNGDPKKANDQALLGFIFGICSLVLFPLFAIPGYIISNSALTKEKLSPGILESGNKGLAKAGLILSIIGFVYLILIIVYVAVFISTWGFGW